jgi:hypothetical protein
MDNIVKTTFQHKTYYQPLADDFYNFAKTCYELLMCDRDTSSMCLDWREVCDGKIDCADTEPLDEAFCFVMEINECDANDEFRCHQGQCIPKSLFQDDPLNPDCLDRSDEITMQTNNNFCFQDPAFRCEEQSCRPGQEDFACGDGQCISEIERCKSGRNNALVLAMFATVTTPGPYHQCRKVMFCFTKLVPSMGDLCRTQILPEFRERLYNALSYVCPSIFPFPSIPILYGRIRFFYNNSQLYFDNDSVLLPSLICDDQKLCDFHPAVLINNFTCQWSSELGFDSSTVYRNWSSLMLALKNRFRSCAKPLYSLENQRYPPLYHCKNSKKLISTHRLVDGISDCFENDDELYNTSCALNDTYRRLCPKENKCLSPLLTQSSCFMYDTSRERHLSIPFQMICNNISQMTPVLIDGRVESDETDCGEQWPCSNLYTRCDHSWACANRSDETGCFHSTCSSVEHDCVSRNNFTMMCLSMNRTNDGIIDCLGTTDETSICLNGHSNQLGTFRCANNDRCISSLYLCDGKNDCQEGNDDEIFCKQILETSPCWDFNAHNRTREEDFLCNIDGGRHPIVHYFKLTSSSTANVENKQDTTLSVFDIPQGSDLAWECNRGLFLRQWIDGKNSEICLCPPSYYGDECQYQNQRVSLTLSIFADDWSTTYILLVMLLTNDKDQQEIHSYEQITHSSQYDCPIKYNIYLLYASRPKEISNNYTVRIDVFTRTRSSVDYHASWKLPISFVFLPVNRMATQLQIPREKSEAIDNCPLDCDKGHKCMRYVKTKELFCLCQPVWWGARCQISINCTDCSNDSLCIGSTNHRSICICPLNRYGPRCRLSIVCTTDSCKNQGTCVPVNDDKSGNNFQCICTEHFTGPTCEQTRSNLEISFGAINQPTHIFLHLITINSDAQPTHTIMVKRIAMDHRSVNFQPLIQFDLVFVEVNNDYYSIFSSPDSNSSLITTIRPSDRCPSFEELFNSTMIKWHPLRRVKYYHWLCSQHRELNCYFDETLMCLCTDERHANCFNLKRYESYACRRHDYCMNDAQCFQDQPICPLVLICLCSNCYYGDRCQFYAEGFSLSLDAILNFEIKRYIPFINQSLMVKMSAMLTMLMFILGLVNGCLSIITFSNKKLREVGCGIYLLALSIISLLIMIVFVLNFWLLFIAQSNLVSNRLFLLCRCITVEPLLKVLFSMNNWLNACVAAERSFTIYRGVNFDKEASKRIAKKTFFLLLIFSIGSNIHESVHRRLLDDVEEQRTWCQVRYPPAVQIFNSVMLIIHFIVPFSINLFSAIFIIRSGAQQQSIIKKKFTSYQLLRIQLRLHKHLLISPMVLMSLAIPRLISSFTTGCVKSSRTPWLYVAGYYISYVSPMLIYIVYIQPSELFKTEFYQTIRRIRQHLTRR